MSQRNCFSLLQQQAVPWTALALQTGEMLAASAQVISLRTGRMAAAGPVPSARDQREFALMTQEKFDAASASAAAMAGQWLSIGGGFGAQVWHGVFETGVAMVSLASSRSVQQYIDRQAELARAQKRSVASTSRLGTAGAQIAHRGLQPIHAAATANARRLTRGLGAAGLPISDR